jgi:hypothetical protein
VERLFPRLDGAELASEEQIEVAWISRDVKDGFVKEGSRDPWFCDANEEEDPSPYGPAS